MIFWVWRGRTVRPQHDMAFPLSVESLHKSNSYTTHGIPKVLVLKFHQQKHAVSFFPPYSSHLAEDNQTSILQQDGLRRLVALLQGAAEAQEPALLLLLALSQGHEQQELGNPVDWMG